ncbi:MAG TPA: hypothetical protein VKY53_11525 [Marinobacter sp.]|nr:hypothetical protein [Marinobacter sp.]
MKAKTSLMTAGLLTAALITTSPVALAEKQDRRGHDGHWNKQDLCENLREGKNLFNAERLEARKARMEKHRSDVAERLKLSDEQREIWAEIHQERDQKHQERLLKWKEKAERRCADASQ